MKRQGPERQFFLCPFAGLYGQLSRACIRHCHPSFQVQSTNMRSKYAINSQQSTDKEFQQWTACTAPFFTWVW